jgi:hypothetical protein
MREQASQKRRRQILTDETGESGRPDSLTDETKWLPEDPWVRNFIVRLARILRKTGGKD